MPSEPFDEPTSSPASLVDSSEKTRIAWKTAAFVGAMLAVWALGLGLVGRSNPDTGGATFQASPSARVERRPALFAITWERRGANAGPGALGLATPIALVEPGGAIVPPISARTDETALAESRAFSATYYEPSDGLLLLRGGAAAGDVRISGEVRMLGQLPVVAVAGTGPIDLGPLDVNTTTLLAISDRRFAGHATGVRAMRDEHRSAVDIATRQILRDRFASSFVVDEGLAKVRVADLDRDGRTEVLASRIVRIRDTTGTLESVALFLIAEPEGLSATEESGYRIAFVALQVVSEGGPSAAIVFIDQADLTSAAHDEVILRLDDGNTFRYVVLRRDQTAWSQVSSTSSMPAPSQKASSGEKPGG